MSIVKNKKLLDYAALMDVVYRSIGKKILSLDRNSFTPENYDDLVQILTSCTTEESLQETLKETFKEAKKSLDDIVSSKDLVRLWTDHAYPEIHQLSENHHVIKILDIGSKIKLQYTIDNDLTAITYFLVTDKHTGVTEITFTCKTQNITIL